MSRSLVEPSTQRENKALTRRTVWTGCRHWTKHIHWLQHTQQYLMKHLMQQIHWLQHAQQYNIISSDIRSSYDKIYRRIMQDNVMT